MTMKKAMKVTKRGWSFKRFKEAVVNEAKRLGVSIKGRAERMQACYNEGVTVRDTVNVLQES